MGWTEDQFGGLPKLLFRFTQKPGGFTKIKREKGGTDFTMRRGWILSGGSF
jgi:hypothetical protein